MNWTRRQSRTGNPNGFKAKFGPINIEVFQDTRTKNWVLKIPQMKIREEIADPNVGQAEVVLDLAEKAAIKHLTNLRSTTTLAINAIRAYRKYPKPINWNGEINTINIDNG